MPAPPRIAQSRAVRHLFLSAGVAAVWTAFARTDRSPRPAPVVEDEVPWTGETEWQSVASVDEQDALAREVRACDVRLGLLPSVDRDLRDQAFRRELLDRRARAAERLAELDRRPGARAAFPQG